MAKREIEVSVYLQRRLWLPVREKVHVAQPSTVFCNWHAASIAAAASRTPVMNNLAPGFSLRLFQCGFVNFG